MTAPAEPRWILCGGATHKAAPSDALRLGFGPGPWEQVRINISGLEESLTGRLGARWRDLLNLAALVLSADCASSRGTTLSLDNGASWRRDFNFVVPMAEPDFWAQPKVRRVLETTLGFLSDDRYRFHFVSPSGIDQEGPLFLPAVNGRTFVPWSHINEVMLFSGGMDSFAGAAEACLVHHRNVLLVTHRSSTKLFRARRDLVDDLRGLTGRANPWQMELAVEKSGRIFERDENQRTRSFLFAAIGGAVASLVGLDRVHFYENGIIALNLPIARQLVGAQGTRTVHPRVVSGFTEVLGLVADGALRVENPYQDLTRAEVAERIRDAGARSLLRHTRSCAKVRTATTQHPNCGVCSQCVDRQFAVRAVGMIDDDPDSLYETRVFRDAIDNDDVQLPLGYVDTARRLAGIGSPQTFLAHYGEVATALPGLQRMWDCTEDEALTRLWQLHRRQSSMVLNVLKEAVTASVPDVLEGSYHPHSLVGRCLAIASDTAHRAHGVDATPSPTPAPPSEPGPALGSSGLPAEVLTAAAPLSRNTFKRNHGVWVMGLADRPAATDAHRRGYLLLAELLRMAPDGLPALALDAFGRPAPAAVKQVPTGEELGKGEGRARGKTTSVHQVTDDTAVRTLKARAAAIQEDLAEAEEMADTAEVEKLNQELEAIARRLGADVGLRGEPRVVDADREKARQRVKANLDEAMARIKKMDIELWRHLHRFVERGGQLNRYRPDHAMEWDL